MHLDDKKEMAFVMEWGVLVIVVMMFDLKTALETFQQIIIEIFGEYIPTFMQVFLDYFAVYRGRTQHLDHLRMCLEKCQNARLSLNLAKCAFGVTSGALLGHIVNKEGIATDLDKLKAIPRHLHQHRKQILGADTVASPDVAVQVSGLADYVLCARTFASAILF